MAKFLDTPYLSSSLSADMWSFQSILCVKNGGRALLFPLRIFDGHSVNISDKTIVAVFDKITLGPCHLSELIHEGTFTMANSIVSSKESGRWRVVAAFGAASSNETAEKDLLNVLERSWDDYI